MADTVSTTHHTLAVESWFDDGGVQVTNFDDPDDVVLLLRDRSEVDRLVAALYAALADDHIDADA